MMNVKRLRPMLLVTMMAVSSCGGGGTASSGTTPPPPPPPPPPPSTTFALLLKPVTADQQFPVAGASFESKATDAPKLGSTEQLQVRYLASSNTYEVQLPNSQTWIGLTGKSESEAVGGAVTVTRQLANDYGSVLQWSVNGSSQGIEAVGTATVASAIPVNGSAVYTAIALGATSESGNGGDIVDRSVIGSMTLSFDFGAGSLSGRIVASLDPEWHDYPLDTLNFRDTAYSVGKTTFSGKFDTSLSGLNSFEGLFTGSAAQGVIGNFAFPYRSPLDGKTYQAGGAFVGSK